MEIEEGVTATTDNSLRDLHNSPEDTQPHSLIVNYTMLSKHGIWTSLLKIKNKLKIGCFYR